MAHVLSQVIVNDALKGQVVDGGYELSKEGTSTIVIPKNPAMASVANSICI